MNSIKSFCFLALITAALGEVCTTPNTIFSSDTMSTIFQGILSTLEYDGSAFDLISDPTSETFKSYFLSNGAYFIPLWCLGGLTLVLFLLCSLQLCCFHCCGQQGCGTKISKKSYRPCLVSLLVYSYLFLSLVLIGLGIVSFMMSSDLLKQADYTICRVDNTLTELFDGKSDGTSPPWSGVDNFNQYASQISTNFQSVVGKLADIFSSTQYQNVVSTASGSLFSNAVATYDCPTSLASSTVSCPFPNLTSCLNSSDSQIPTFSSNFCLTTVNNSAASLILKQQLQNSSTWKSKLNSLASLLIAYNNSKPNFDELQQYSESLQSSITQYKPQLTNGIQAAQDQFHSVEIGLYAVFGFFIFLGVFAFLSVFCTYCGRSFGWRYTLYFLWVFFMLLGVLFFAASGFFIVGTFTGYDSCKVYAELTQNQTAIPSLSYYEDSSVTQVLFTCFFPPQNSTDTIFNSANQQTNFQQLNELQNQYYSALPSDVFNTVASDIRDTLDYYQNNQNQVVFLGANANQNPQAALEQANIFASNGGSSKCNAVDDTFVFNPVNCYPLLLDQPANNPSCILLSSSSGSVITNRESSFISHNCSSNYTLYTNYFNSLNSYGEAVSALTSQYSSDPKLSTYENNYFNYYEAVSDFMSSSTKNMFTSFINPYGQLVQGSSCSFLTQSLEGLVTYTCNNDFPYLYVFSIITITLSCVFFFMMIISFYLTTRMEFYEHLDGDLSKYDPEAPEDDSIKIQMADFTNRQQLLQPQPVQQKDFPPTPDQSERTDYNQHQDRQGHHYSYHHRYGHSDPRYRYHRDNRYDEPRPSGLASPPKHINQDKR